MAVDDIYTKLLLHMDGDNNGTVFTDESGKTVTRIGNTCTKTDHCLRDVTKAKTYYASSSYNSSWVPANAFNDDLSTGWHSLNNANNEWIAVDLGTGNTCVFDALSFIPRVDGNAQVKDFTFYGSNDSTNGADGSWTQIGTGTHTNSATWQFFNFMNSVAYRWAKVVCNTSYHTNFLGGSIIEMEIGTIDKKFGTATAYFDGNNDALQVPLSSDLQFGTDAFTIDFWIYTTSQVRGYPIVFCNTTIDIIGGLLFYAGRPGKANKYVVATMPNGSFTESIVSNATIAFNEWSHVALIRNNNILSLYINGVFDKSTIASEAINGSGTYFAVGMNSALTPDCSYTGYIDEFRISKGIARWTENFTPPILPYISKTYILSGTAELAPGALPVITAPPTTSAILWTADVPSGTSLSIKTAIGLTPPAEEDYIEAINGGQIPGLDMSASEKFLYIKAYLATTDSSKTPKLISVSYFIDHAADKATIHLNLTDTGRLKYPIGDVLVAYNKTLGSLTGLQGGQVQSFSIPFTPSLTTRIFNPNDAEKINAALSVISSNMRIYYEYYRSDNTHIQASLGALTQIIAVADIPV